MARNSKEQLTPKSQIFRFDSFDVARKEYSQLESLTGWEEAAFPAWSNTITGINGGNKFSREACNCLIVVMSGVSHNGEAVSMMAHVTPNIAQTTPARLILQRMFSSSMAESIAGFTGRRRADLLRQKAEEVQRSMNSITKEFEMQTAKAGREVLVFGGSTGEDSEGIHHSYEEILRTVGKAVAHNLGVSINVPFPPKVNTHRTDVYYDTAAHQAIVVES